LRVGRTRLLTIAVAAVAAAAGVAFAETASGAPTGAVGEYGSGLTAGGKPSRIAAGQDDALTGRRALRLRTAALPAGQRTKLDAAVRRAFRAAASPGALVAVQTPTGRWVKAIGVASTASKAPMRATMHQRIGSVTKTFIGALLMQLVGEGKVSLDDTIDRYVAGFPNGSSITLRQAATMTSGAGSYTKNPRFQQAFLSDTQRLWKPIELLRFGAEESPAFAPGTQFEYSNTNTVLLGMVIERVEGKALGAVLRERIFKPLGLRHTWWPGSSPRLPRPHPQGYTLQGQPGLRPANATYWNPSWAWAAGAVVSTVSDLLVYGRATGTGRGLLAPAQQRVRLNSVITDLPPLSAQLGYGIALTKNHRWVGHTGALPGYNTTVYHHAGIGTTVVVAANSDIASGRCNPRAPFTRGRGVARASCVQPAERIMAAVSRALGQRYVPIAL
jgi:D-alanyl-D-alanine carboxypeptidase